MAKMTEIAPFFADQATIALMQLSIDHLQLLETMAVELQALSARSSAPHLSGELRSRPSGLSAGRLAFLQAAGEQDRETGMESTWER